MAGGVMRSLLLVAASGLAREALDAIHAAGGYDVVGIVDDDPSRWGELVGGAKVIGGLDVVHHYSDAAVLLCAGRGAARASLAERLGLDDSRYATVVHPDVYVPATCEVGIGSIVLAGCVLTTDVTVGRHVVLMPHVTLTHDDEIADFATLCGGVTLGGSVHIGEHCYLGMNASVREDVRIGANTLIGMGSVVLSDISPNEVWFGVPARRAPKRTSREQLRELRYDR